MNENNLILLYVIIDDFFKSFYKTDLWETMKVLWINKRGFQKKMSLSEVICLNIFRFFLRIEDLKTFHRHIKEWYPELFPNVPNYENFLKATNRSAVFLCFFLRYFLYINVFQSKGNRYFIDSTDLPVCKNYNIYKHKVTKALARRGKTSKGWFYGFKLHAYCNETSDIMNIFFTSGEVHDNKAVKDLILDVKGIFTADAGYLLKKEELQYFFDNEQIMYIATRKNMKRIATKTQINLFTQRSKIENIWDVLKERFKIIYSLARSIHGLFRHYFYSIASYIIYGKIKLAEEKSNYEKEIILAAK